MKGYKDQKACRNCKYYRDIECHGHFCEVDKTEYPVQKQSDKAVDWKEVEAFQDTVWKWRETHSVEPSGICDLHEEGAK